MSSNDNHMSRIQYKSLISTGKPMTGDIITEEDKVETFLLNEHRENRTWNQLDKLSRIERLNNYVDKIGAERDMNENDIILFKEYLKNIN